jgi:hypothetical protein
MSKRSNKFGYHLRVFGDRSELQVEDGSVTVFKEGAMSPAARKRYERVTKALRSGFLISQIRLCRTSPHSLDWTSLREEHEEALRALTDSVTSEVGRAIVGLTLLQLIIKSIEPKQSIRLHKGGYAAAAGFGWVEGVSMRRLDAEFVTPVLRHEGLMNLNSDGFMMTRSLAENYPYSKVYKAAIRGARGNWLSVVDWLEDGTLPAEPALQFVISQLINRAETFNELASKVQIRVRECIRAGQFCSTVAVEKLILKHISASDYKARVFEVAIHSFMQAFGELGALGDSVLVPLSQMRSANKKHGNIGDVELVENRVIIEAWDGKYGKDYLRDELDELNEKLVLHPSARVVGFVCSGSPDLSEEILVRVRELEEVHDTRVLLVSFSDWVEFQQKRVNGVHDETLAKAWIRSYSETLSQMRRNLAPIDEPCQQWLESLLSVLSES